jgi:large subunit ribosomal protein L1
MLPRRSRKSRPVKWNSASTRGHHPFARSARSAFRPNLAGNAQALLAAVVKAKPAAAKGKYIKKITLTSTMGPGILIDPIEAEDAAAIAVAA